MATLSAIRTQLRTLMNETDANNSHFTNTELDEYINQAQTFLAAFIEYPRQFWTQQVTDGTADYLLPSDMVCIITAYFGDTSTAGDIRPLSVISEETLKSLHPDWLDATTSSKGRPRFLIVKTRTTITLYPRPDTDESASGKKIHLNYVYRPASMSSDSDSPTLPLPYHDLLQFYAAHLAYLRLQIEAMAGKMLGIFSEKVKAIQQEVTRETKQGQRWQWAYPVDLEGDVTGIIIP